MKSTLLSLVVVLCAAGMAQGYAWDITASDVNITPDGHVSATLDMYLDMEEAPGVRTISALNIWSPTHGDAFAIDSFSFTPYYTGWFSPLIPTGGEIIDDLSDPSNIWSGGIIDDNADMGLVGPFGTNLAEPHYATLIVSSLVPVSAGETVVFMVNSEDVSDHDFLYYDPDPTPGEVSIYVPEPATALLLAAGALLIVRRRR